MKMSLFLRITGIIFCAAAGPVGWFYYHDWRPIGYISLLVGVVSYAVGYFLDTRPRPVLRPIPGCVFTLKALSGERTVAQSKDIFRSYISPDFVSCGLDRPGLATPETPMQGYKLKMSASFKQMFTALPVGLELAWITQDQLDELCESHRDGRIVADAANFVLLKKDETKIASEDNLFVVSVRVRRNGLRALVFRFLSGAVWGGERDDRLFVPQPSPPTL
jgi:hypothetical protein